MKNKIILITGETGSGKTNFLKNLIGSLRQKDISVNGILAEGYWHEGNRDRYEIIDLNSGKKIVYCQKTFNRGWEKILHFYVNPAAVSFGENALDPANFVKRDIVAIDEIGPFELQGKGWSNAVTKIITEKPEQPMIWIVRKSLVEAVIKHFIIISYLIIEFEEYEAKEVSSKILNFFAEKN